MFGIVFPPFLPLVQDKQQKEGECHRGCATYDGYHAAGQHPVHILGGCHGNHHRDIHLLPEIHALDERLLFGKGKEFGIVHKQQKQNGKANTTHVSVDTNQRAKERADIFTQEHTQRQGY